MWQLQILQLCMQCHLHAFKQLHVLQLCMQETSIEYDSCTIVHQPCMCESPVVGMFPPQSCQCLAGEDKRTTLMIKNIPNKYTQKMLLTTIDEKFRGTYDFFYLPIDFKNKCNVGYAFINMVRPEYIIPLIQKFDRKKWEKFNSEKVCNISYARIQVSHSHPFQADSVHASLFWGHTTRSQLHYALLVMELQFFHALLDKKLLHLQDIAMQIFV